MENGEGRWDRTPYYFFEEMDVSILSGRRIIAPLGLMGGRNGITGRNTVFAQKWKF